jgi:hypothetical protein
LTVKRRPVDINGVPSEKVDPLKLFFLTADMAELADALGSGPSDRKVVEVRVLLSAPERQLSAVGSQLSGNELAGGWATLS